VRACAAAPRSALHDKLTRDLDAAEAALKDAKADRKESERDRRLAAAVEQLKRHIPGAAPPPARTARSALPPRARACSRLLLMVISLRLPLHARGSRVTLVTAPGHVCPHHPSPNLPTLTLAGRGAQACLAA